MLLVAQSIPQEETSAFSPKDYAYQFLTVVIYHLAHELRLAGIIFPPLPSKGVPTNNGHNALIACTFKT